MQLAPTDRQAAATARVRALADRHLTLPDGYSNQARAVALLMLLLAAPPASLAQGGPPMITDDPGTPGPGNWEINIAATAAHWGRIVEGEWPLLDLNYGVGSRIQLKYEVPWVTQHEH